MEGTEKQAKFEVRETLKKNTSYASLENLHNLYMFPLLQKGNKALHPKVIIDGCLGSVSKLILQLPHS